MREKFIHVSADDDGSSTAAVSEQESTSEKYNSFVDLLVSDQNKI